MSNGYRQEVFNVVLAQLLQERGVIAAPEIILKVGPERKRRMPDVIVNFQGLRMVIEGEVSDQPGAHDKAIASARRRVEDAITHIGVAVVYPEELRQADFNDLKDELADSIFDIAVVSEAEDKGFVSGDLDYLENALRRAYEQLAKGDVVSTAVAIIDAAIERFALVAEGFQGIVWDMSKALDIRMTTNTDDPAERVELSPEESGAVCRIGGLVLMNAMIFQAVLAGNDKRVNSLQDMIISKPMFSSVARPLYEHWRYVTEEIDYFPIFSLAADVLLTLFGRSEWLKDLANTASRIIELKTALRHDLMGRVYHRLLSDAKYLGTYYTGIPAAALLLKLALRPDSWSTQWYDLEQVRQLRIADPSCGTGTLLMAVADAITDNYVSAAANADQPVNLGALQTTLTENTLFGYDVLASAIHLTASTLALRAPEISFDKMNLFSLPLGGPYHRLGSIEFLGGPVVQARDLFGAAPETRQVTGRAMEEVDAPPMPDLDLCVMNPPFTRSVGGNLLFGSAPENERKEMQKKLQRLVRNRDNSVQANITAGLGSVFVAIGDRYIKPGGRLALVLPKALLSGVAWGKTRDLIAQKYRVEYVVVSQDPDRWNFSESTDLSEVLLVAVKVDETAPPPDKPVVVVNLWRNVETPVDALTVAHLLAQNEPPDVTDGQGNMEIVTSKLKMGEAISIPWDRFQENWVHPCAFAQTDLVRAVYHLMAGQLWLPGHGDVADVSLCPLGQFGTLGPDRRDIHDGFNVSLGPTAYPALWGHDADAMTTLAQQPNKNLVPLYKAKEGRSLRKVTDLWPLSGKVLLAERLWLKTQRLFAARLPQPVLANVWWPFSLKKELIANSDQIEKVLVLWLNSTLAILISLAHREETRGAWIGFKKPTLTALPVLDLNTLSSDQLDALAAAYDRLYEQPLQPFPQMATDEVRAEIDQSIADALGLPDFSALRTLLAQEPVVSMKRL